jgi:hypothetical protein
MTSCSLAEILQVFGETSNFHLKDPRVTQAYNKQSSKQRPSETSLNTPFAYFFLGLLFSPEDGGSIFLRNISQILTE